MLKSEYRIYLTIFPGAVIENEALFFNKLNVESLHPGARSK